MIKKLIALVGVLLLTTALRTLAASTSSNVVATFSIADLGQGIWGGGALFADGTASGEIPFDRIIEALELIP